MGLLLLTTVGCSGQTLHLLTRNSGAILISSCFILGLGDSLCVLPDLGSTDNLASSSHSHNIHAALVASCKRDLEITTIHCVYEYGLSSRFPPGRGSGLLEWWLLCRIVYVLISTHNKSKLIHCSLSDEDPLILITSSLSDEDPPYSPD